MKIELWDLVKTLLQLAIVPAIVFCFKISGRVTTLEVKMEKFWENASINLGDIVHSPTDHFGLDWYIDGHKAGMLSRKETEEYKRLLEVRAKDETVDKIRRCVFSNIALYIGNILENKQKDFPRKK